MWLDDDLRSLIVLLAPVFYKQSTRENLLLLAFPSAKKEYPRQCISLEGEANHFITRLIIKLHSDDDFRAIDGRPSLAVLLEQIIGQRPRLSEHLLPIIEKLYRADVSDETNDDNAGQVIHRRLMEQRSQPSNLGGYERIKKRYVRQTSMPTRKTLIKRIHVTIRAEL